MSAVDPLTRLALQARAGDADALGGFVETGYEQVWRFCATLVGRQEADDASQETFVRAVRSLPQFRGESSAQTWLLAIARHVCIDELRTRARRRRRDTALGSSQERSDADAGAGITAADLIGRLDHDRRAAFVLTQVLGLSYAEAARVCECPPGTIRSRVARARADLISFLARPERDVRQGRSSSA